jgi:hypothetical protein
MGRSIISTIRVVRAESSTFWTRVPAHGPGNPSGLEQWAARMFASSEALNHGKSVCQRRNQMSTALSRLFTRVAATAALALIASVVSAQDVGYNAMPGNDFGKYKTYKWVQIKDAQYPDAIMAAQIQQSIDTQLAAKGLTKSEADTADLYVGYQVAVDQEKQWNSYSTGGAGWGWGGGYHGYGYGGGGTSTTTSSTIQIGTIGVDMYDTAAKQLVWRGKASKTLDPKAKPEKRQKNIEKAMTKLLKNYPPPAKK